MTLTLDEQQLVAHFRALDVAAQRELLDHAQQLRRRTFEPGQGESGQGAQCSFKGEEVRPEAAKEPLFTE
jgi:hypothetical protein